VRKRRRRDRLNRSGALIRVRCSLSIATSAKALATPREDGVSCAQSRKRPLVLGERALGPSMLWKLGHETYSSAR
jgi:hypothetical protein